jgi:hypothetical protein
MVNARNVKVNVNHLNVVRFVLPIVKKHVLVIVRESLLLLVEDKNVNQKNQKKIVSPLVE